MGPAAVSVPSRRPRPLPADLTRAAAWLPYKQRWGRAVGSWRPGSCVRCGTPDPPPPDPETPDSQPQDPGTIPWSSRRAGNHLCSSHPRRRRPGKGAISAQPRGSPRRSHGICAKVGHGPRTPGSSTAQAHWRGSPLCTQHLTPERRMEDSHPRRCPAAGGRSAPGGCGTNRQSASAGEPGS